MGGGNGYFYETDWRGYDPQLGRFKAVDALADFIPSISPYQFAFNNPISLNDPTGLAPDDKKFEKAPGPQVYGSEISGALRYTRVQGVVGTITSGGSSGRLNPTNGGGAAADDGSGGDSGLDNNQKKKNIAIIVRDKAPIEDKYKKRGLDLYVKTEQIIGTWIYFFVDNIGQGADRFEEYLGDDFASTTYISGHGGEATSPGKIKVDDLAKTPDEKKEAFITGSMLWNYAITGSSGHSDKADNHISSLLRILQRTTTQCIFSSCHGGLGDKGQLLGQALHKIKPSLQFYLNQDLSTQVIIDGIFQINYGRGITKRDDLIRGWRIVTANTGSHYTTPKINLFLKTNAGDDNPVQYIKW